VLGAALRVVDGDARVLAFDNAIQGFVEGEIGGQGKISGRATMTSRTVMLSSSMALWIISSETGEFGRTGGWR